MEGPAPARPIVNQTEAAKDARTGKQPTRLGKPPTVIVEGSMASDEENWNLLHWPQPWPGKRDKAK